ncbi:hypothetical protein [Chromatium okenii]|jgi:hypothetical protein|uniref:Uncharacterized protein n=1 Tax=Chromatium okenii TaxID=61644 RepID=A0A2S7XTS6_9GAMM|nr:hypothetical protein [Chromatium okenii]MBV5308907.1 hypothetical protein [Chromatium okenii]PQJ96923.1 hypothetical protein CXB77_05010 [Chromatium okenii]
MKKALPVLLALFSVLFFNTANAKDRVIEGVISDYACGDNCYLTIVDAKGKERGGLCGAPLCEKFDEDDMSKFKGRKVRVTVGRGVQKDSAGNVMGKMDLFKKIILLKK